MQQNESYELVGGPLCGGTLSLGRVPDGSNVFLNVASGRFPDEIVMQVQYCLHLPERRLFFVSELCLNNPSPNPTWHGQTHR